MLSLRELLEVAAASETVDYVTARKSLPIAFLMERYGHPVTVEAGRIKALCPFHDDSNPSFTVFGEDLDHWSCWGCNARGDAVDLLKRFEPDLVGEDGKDTSKVFRRIRALINEVIDTDWAGPQGGTAPEPFNVQDAQEIVNASAVEVDYDRIGEFLAAKRAQRGENAWPYSAAYLVDEWDVGTYGSWLIIPFWKDDGELLSFKRWTDPSKPRFTKGAGIWSGHLYGEWREDTGLPILLCEGESDTWYAHYHVGERFRVLGLPVGVNSATSPAAEMSERTVYLAFDADGDDTKGGRMATRMWADALEDVEANVRILPIPEGKDLSTAGDINQLISQARPLVKAPAGIVATPQGYSKVEKNGTATQLSNWVFVPTRGLRGTGTFAFEGRLRPGGDYAVIRTGDLASDTKLTQWAGSYGRAWLGTTTETRKLLAMLQADEVFLPSGQMVNTAGLHGNTFVWSGGQIGPEPVVYVPPAYDAHLDIRVNPGRWDTDILHLMRSIQARHITDPMLAWMAVAPLRVRAERFPFVAVTGSFGSGKSETTETLVRAFSGSWVQNTFLSSPHGITSTIAATNGFVVQLEEYRRNANVASLERFEQLAREAYTMQASQKGGLGEHWAILTEIVPAAPFIVTGESKLIEGSHIERSILLNMDAKYQAPEPFNAVRRIGTNGFPHAYLSWLQAKIMDNSIPNRLPIVPTEIATLGSRQQYNLGVLAYGWQLLQEFMSDHNDSLSEPDFSHVIERLRSANAHTPTEDALLWAIGDPDAHAFCRLVKNEIWVQADSLFSWLSHPSRSMLFPLPGNSSALKDYLTDKLHGERRTKDLKSYIVIDYSKLTNEPIEGT